MTVFAEQDGLQTSGLLIGDGAWRLKSAMLRSEAARQAFKLMVGDDEVELCGARRGDASGHSVIKGAAMRPGTSDTAITVHHTGALEKPDVFLVRCEIIGAAAAGWSFNGFEGLSDDPVVKLLCGARFSKVALTVAEQAGAYGSQNEKYKQGLNFTADLADLGLLGPLASLATNGAPLKLHGRIILPPSEALRGPKSCDPPWKADSPPPGVLLQVDLAGNALLGELIEISDVTFHLYLPPSAEWAQHAAGVAAAAGVTGKMTLRLDGAAPITSLMSGAYRPESGGIDLDAVFENVSIANLTQLKEFKGIDEKLQELPASIRKLANLELLRLVVGLEKGLSPAAVRCAGITFGIPEKWRPLPDWSVEIGNLYASVMVMQPFAKPTMWADLGGTLTLGGVDINTGVQIPGAAAYAELAPGSKIKLLEILQQFAPAARNAFPADAALDIDELVVEIDPKFKRYYLRAGLADDPGFYLNIGPKKLLVCNTRLEVEKRANKSVEFEIEGSLQYDNNIFLDLRYQSPGGFSGGCTIQSIKLADLIRNLCGNHTLSLPAGFDIEFQQTELRLDAADGEYAFLAATRVDGLGGLAFTARKASGAWGFAVGVVIESGGVDALARHAPTIGAPIKSFADYIGLEKLLFVVSSLTSPQFSFPDLSKFDTPTLRNATVTLPSGAGLVRGVNIYAKMNIAKNEPLQKLAALLGIKPIEGGLDAVLAVALPNPSDGSKFYLTTTAKVCDGELTGSLGLMMRKGAPAAFLEATYSKQIDGKRYRAMVVAAVFPNGLIVGGEFIGSIDLKLCGKAIKITDAALMIGISWQGVPSFGIAGVFSAERFQASVVLSFDSTNPLNSMLAGSISDVSIADLAADLADSPVLSAALITLFGSFALTSTDAFTLPADSDAAKELTAYNSKAPKDGETSSPLTPLAQDFNTHGKVSDLSPAPDKTLLTTAAAGSSWHLTNLETMEAFTLTKQADGAVKVTRKPQLYIVPSNVLFFSKSYKQGMRVCGRLRHWLIQVKVDVSIFPGEGVRAEVDIENQLTIGPEEVFCISNADNLKKGPYLYISTYKYQDKEPQVFVSGTVRLLGQTFLNVHIDINNDNGIFKCAANPPMLKFDLEGKLKSRAEGNRTSLTVSGTVLYTPAPLALANAALGKLKIKDGVELRLNIHYLSPNLNAYLTGKISFLGESVDVARIKLEGVNLDQMADVLGKAVTEAVSPILKDAEKWVKAIKNDVIEPVSKEVDAIAAILKREFNKNPEGAILLLVSIGFPPLRIAIAIRTLYRMSSGALAKLMEEKFNIARDQLETAIKGVKVVAYHIKYEKANMARAVVHELKYNKSKIARNAVRSLADKIRDIF